MLALHQIGEAMKKAITLVTVLIVFGVFVSSTHAQLLSNFPDLSKFEMKIACYDDKYPPAVKSKKLTVDLYFLDKNEVASHNELVTLITIVETGRQFAAHLVLDNVESDIQNIKAHRSVYMKFGTHWQEFIDFKYTQEVIANAPKEYILDYRFNPPGKPANDLEAYKNILKNAGCSLHGPIG